MTLTHGGVPGTTRRLATMLLAGAAIAGCGEEQAPSSPNGADRAFAQLMVPHHESAVEMAELAAQRGQSAFVRELAADVVRSQTREIATLRAEDRALAQDGIAAGDLGVPEDEMGMDHDVGTLRSAEPFDEAFLQMMIPHHEGAITMAEAELERGGDPELRTLAEQIIETQEREIEAMRERTGDAPDAHGGHG